MDQWTSRKLILTFVSIVLYVLIPILGKQFDLPDEMVKQIMNFIATSLGIYVVGNVAEKFTGSSDSGLPLSDPNLIGQPDPQGPKSLMATVNKDGKIELSLNDPTAK